MSDRARLPDHRLAALLSCLLGCAIEPNYVDPDGPRYAADHARVEPAPGGDLRVVSYNLAFGREVDLAIAALRSEPLAVADLILMQEVDADAVDRIASALELRYVYYPASIKMGRDWGNAILSRWPIARDHKVLLPHADPYTDTRRIAVAAAIDRGDHEVLVYSAHIGTPTLGLGARLDQIEAMLVDAGDLAPAVIGGDFNTSDPGSTGQVLELLAGYDLAWASDQATDTSSRFGLDYTLDYVFARGLVSEGSGTFVGEAGSDHRPIWVVLRSP